LNKNTFKRITFKRVIHSVCDSMLAMCLVITIFVYFVVLPDSIYKSIFDGIILATTFLFAVKALSN